MANILTVYFSLKGPHTGRHDADRKSGKGKHADGGRIYPERSRRRSVRD